MVTPLPAHSGRSPRAPGPDERRELASRTLEQFRQARVAGPGTCRDLMEQVVVAHLWLADAIARRYRTRGEEADDLCQIARAGLVEACSRFDLEQGGFVAFASATVTGVVRHHFRDHAWSIRPSRSAQELSTLIWRRWPEIAQTVAGEPSEGQVAETLGVTAEEVRRARRASQAYSWSSVDTLTQQFGTDDCDVQQCEARLLVESVWCDLAVSERRLLRMRFVDERTQVDIAHELGVTQMQVSRLLGRLMTKLRGLIGGIDDVRPAAA